MNEFCRSLDINILDKDEDGLNPESSENSDEESYNSALFHAIRKRKGKDRLQEKYKIQNIKAVLKNGGDINASDRNNKGNTLLHIAIEKGYSKIVSFLLSQSGINISIVNEQQKTALDIAKHLKRDKIIYLLDNYVPKDKCLETQYQVGTVEFLSGTFENETLTDTDTDISSSVCKDFPGDTKRKDFTDKKKGFALSCHGLLFQFNIIMLIIKRALKENLNFSLRSEVAHAGKFDDVVFKFEKSDKIVYFLIQAKHFKDRSKCITVKDLKEKGSTRRKLGLPIYFESYLDIKRKDEFQNAEVFYFLCTNVSFSTENLGKEVTLVEQVSEYKTLFEEGIAYKLQLNKNSNIRKILVEQFKEYTQNILNTNVESEIDNFFDKFQFVVNLPDESSLYEIVKSEVGRDSQFSFRNDERFMQSFREEIINWMKAKESSSLSSTDCEELLSKIEYSSSKIITELVNEHCLSKYKKCNVQFDMKYCNDLRDVLVNEDSRNLVITSNSVLLSIAKILQILSDMEWSYLCVNLKLLSQEEIRDRVKHFLFFESSTALVIPCTEKQISDHLSALKEIITVNSKILIVTNDRRLTLRESLNDLTEFVEEVKCQDLTKESRRELLQKTISFQGRIIRLEELINDKLELVSTDTFEEIIEGSEHVEIGNKLLKMEYYYISRTFYPMEISLLHLSKIESDDYIVIINPSPEIKKQKHSENIILTVFSENERDIERQIEMIRLNHQNGNIHVFKYEFQKLFWLQTFGSISNIYQFVQPYTNPTSQAMPEKISNEYSSEYSFINEVQKKKVVIISDTAGMGKTTTLTNISLKIKDSDPTLWVARIDLNDHSNALFDILTQYKEFDVIEVVHFVAEKLLSLQGTSLNIFEHCCRSEGRVVMLFDGFDEISSIYGEVVMHLFQFLMKSNIQQIWITTRPNMRKKLEIELQVFAYTISPFSNADQVKFLVEFWRSSLKIDNLVEKEKLRGIATAVIDLLSKSVDDKEKEFTGIPLLTRMLAEAFQHPVQDELLSKSCTPITEINLIKLYEWFVFKKIDVFLQQKVKADTGVAGADWSREKLQKILLKEHEFLAFHTLFDEKELNVVPQREINDLLHELENGKYRSGIIEGIVDGRVKFIHRTFLEYFAASFTIKHLVDFTELQHFFSNKVLLNPEYQVVRSFINGMVKVNYFDVTELSFKTTENILKQILNLALSEGNSYIIRFFLNIDENAAKLFGEMLVNEKDVNDNTILHTSVIKNQFEITELLIQEGANVNAVNEYNETPLHKASVSGYLKIAKLLVENNADILAKNYNLETPLHFASRGEHLDIVKLLISAGTNVNTVNFNEETPLHVVTKLGYSFSIVELLVREGSDVMKEDKYGDTPLHNAVARGQFDVMVFLINNGASTSTRNRKAETILYKAVIGGNLKIVKYLIDLVPEDIDSLTNDGDSILHGASKSGNLELVKLLMENGNSVKAVNHNGDTVLHGAAAQGDLEIARYLISKGADVKAKNHTGSSVLLESVSSQNLNIISLLLDAGADIQQTTKNGDGILHLAASFGNSHHIHFLLQKGANMHAVNKLGESVLHKSALSGSVGIMKLLIEKGANINAENCNRSSVLHYAVEGNSLEATKFLIQNNADINARNASSETALYIACANGHFEIAKLLTENNADIHVVKTSTRNSLLHTATEAQNINLVNLLLEKGADINARNCTNNTVLHCAIMGDHLDIAKLLIKKNADANVKNFMGNSCLHMAADKGYFSIVQLLIKKGANIRDFNNANMAPFDLAYKNRHYEVATFLESCTFMECGTKNKKKKSLCSIM